ncbi:MAG: polyprenyl synthetase family protein [Ardenticatenaceae bacterium]|nr:polyprenyl synthetase family protein [Ardenticatenaceae bacterium]
MQIYNIDTALTAVEDALISVVDTDVETLKDASEHIILSGGKRVRPQLLILAYQASGGKNLAESIRIAAAIELVHTATLVHDDINDHSDFRRGRLAVHKRWGRTFALLTGDYLFTKVYELMAPYGNPFNEIMAKACVRLVEGETLQAHAAKTGDIDRETYKKIIARKTASLFEAAAEMGGLLAGASPETVAGLKTYGYNLGLTFQLVDDILDVVGSADEMGKPIGLDLNQGRGVFAVENGAAVASPPVTKLADDDPVQRMMNRMRDSGAIEIAKLQAQEMGERARAGLRHVPQSEFKMELNNLIDSVLNRRN